MTRLALWTLRRGDCTPAPRACWACFARPLNAVARSAQEGRATHRSARRTCIRQPSTLNPQPSTLSLPLQTWGNRILRARPACATHRSRSDNATDLGLAHVRSGNWMRKTQVCGRGFSNAGAGPEPAAWAAKAGRLWRAGCGGRRVHPPALSPQPSPTSQPSRRPGATASTPRSPRAQPVGLSPPRSQTRGWRTYVPGNGCARPRSVGGLMGRRDWPGGGGGARSARAEGPASSRAGGRARGRQPARGLAELDAAVDEDRLAGDVVGVL